MSFLSCIVWPFIEWSLSVRGKETIQYAVVVNVEDDDSISLLLLFVFALLCAVDDFYKDER